MTRSETHDHDDEEDGHDDKDYEDDQHKQMLSINRSSALLTHDWF